MRSALFWAAILPLAACALESVDKNNFFEGPGVVRFPLAGNKEALDKHLRRQVEAGLANRQTGFFYTIDLEIGTPPQTVAVNFDTGSSELWVNPNCAKSSDEAYCKTFGAFGKSASFTSLNQNATLKYGRGHADVEYGYDYVTVGTSKINQQILGVAHDSEFATTGLMGVGPNLRGWNSPYPYILDNLFTQKFINSRAFSLDLRQVTSARGAVVFGGIDTKKFKGPLIKRDIIPAGSAPDGKTRYWATCDSITVNQEDGSKINVQAQPQAYLFDSGYTISSLPTTIFNELLKAFPSAKKDSNDQYLVDCGVVKTTGTLDFKFDNATIRVPYSDFIWQQPNFNSCVLGAVPDDKMPVLGDTFLRAAYVVYDWDNRALHFAAADDCGSNLVAIGSGSGAVTVTEGDCAKTESTIATSTSTSSTSTTTTTSSSTTTSTTESSTTSPTTSSTTESSTTSITDPSTTSSATSSTTDSSTDPSMTLSATSSTTNPSNTDLSTTESSTTSSTTSSTIESSTTSITDPSTTSSATSSTTESSTDPSTTSSATSSTTDSSTDPSITLSATSSTTNPSTTDLSTTEWSTTSSTTSSTIESSTTSITDPSTTSSATSSTTESSTDPSTTSSTTSSTTDPSITLSATSSTTNPSTTDLSTTKSSTTSSTTSFTIESSTTSVTDPSTTSSTTESSTTTNSSTTSSITISSTTSSTINVSMSTTESSTTTDSSTTSSTTDLSMSTTESSTTTDSSTTSSTTDLSMSTTESSTTTDSSTTSSTIDPSTSTTELSTAESTMESSTTSSTTDPSTSTTQSSTASSTTDWFTTSSIIDPSTSVPQTTDSIATTHPGNTTYTPIVTTARTHTITSCAPTVTNCPVGKVTSEVITLYTTWYPEENQPKPISTESQPNPTNSGISSTSAYTKPPCPEVTLTFVIPKTYYCTKGQTGCTEGEEIVTSHPATIIPITPVATPTPIPGCVDCHPKKPAKPAQTPAPPAGVIPVAVNPHPVETKEQVPAQSTPAAPAQPPFTPAPKPEATQSKPVAPVKSSTLASVKPHSTGVPIASQPPVVAGATGLYVPGLAAVVAAVVAVI